MLTIAVISDTHSQAIPEDVLCGLQKADMVIHAGDVCDAAMLKQCAGNNNFQAVYGNMDDAALREKLPRRLILQCEDVKIGVFHGEGAPPGLVDRVEEEFKGEKVDVIIFGHSHQPLNEKIDDVLFFNPGSPNDTIFSPYCSYGVIKVKGNKIQAKIIKVK